MAKGMSTYKTFLMIKKTNSGNFEKLLDIKDYPDMGGAPEMLETTTLSDRATTTTPGIQQQDSLEFTTNYTKENYNTIKSLLDKEYEFSLWFGATDKGADVTPTGSDGKFDFKGQISAYVAGGGVNEVRDLKISIATSIAPHMVE